MVLSRINAACGQLPHAHAGCIAILALTLRLFKVKRIVRLWVSVISFIPQGPVPSLANRAQNLLRCKRHVQNSHAYRIVERVRNRRRDGKCPCFPHALCAEGRKLKFKISGSRCSRLLCVLARIAVLRNSDAHFCPDTLPITRPVADVNM